MEVLDNLDIFDYENQYHEYVVSQIKQRDYNQTIGNNGNTKNDMNLNDSDLYYNLLHTIETTPFFSTYGFDYEDERYEPVVKHVPDRINGAKITTPLDKDTFDIISDAIMNSCNKITTTTTNTNTETNNNTIFEEQEVLCSTDNFLDEYEDEDDDDDDDKEEQEETKQNKIDTEIRPGCIFKAYEKYDVYTYCPGVEVEEYLQSIINNFTDRIIESKLKSRLISKYIPMPHNSKLMKFLQDLIMRSDKSDTLRVYNFNKDNIYCCISDYGVLSHDEFIVKDLIRRKKIVLFNVFYNGVDITWKYRNKLRYVLSFCSEEFCRDIAILFSFV